ncbi:MAG: asparagine synthase [Bacteroidales bacterium]|nr:asparagine synthase [Bacteroidales bacterium]
MQESFEISPCETHGIFVDNFGRMASNPGSLADMNSQINDEAVFSLLQFGAIIPPLTPWKGIHRLLPGYKYHGTETVGPIELYRKVQVSESSDHKQQADEIEKLFDNIFLRNIGDQKDPVLLFSGGVDSGFIASRLAALGYYDSVLINYSFGDDDEESKLAEAMARHLKLKYIRVSIGNDLCQCLREPGLIYSQPFGDSSTVPTSDLAFSVTKHIDVSNRMILDGTGADGLFGATIFIDKWKRIYRVPRLIRKVAALPYAYKLWHSEGSLEYYSRICRRSVEMPMISAIFAQNPLTGLFYNNIHKEHIDSLLFNWISPWAGESLINRYIGYDLALLCASICAQKALPILEAAGHKVLFPFLDIKTVRMVLSTFAKWKMDETKAPLKKSLARHIPQNMIYRPKSGFTDPKATVFYQSEFIDYLRSAIEPTSQIGHLLIKKPLLKACYLLTQRKKLPYQTLNLLWAIVFTDRWYRTVRKTLTMNVDRNTVCYYINVINRFFF